MVDVEDIYGNERTYYRGELEALGFETSFTISNASNQYLLGTASADTLIGDARNSHLYGMSASDTLFDGAGDDQLDGGAGADRMKGGVGDDVYWVDNAGDRIVELPRRGTDTVNASISHTLAADVENLILLGTENLRGVGNGGANRMTGNAGSNDLEGGAGNDSLDGGASADRMKGGVGDDVYWVDSSSDKTVELAREGADTVIASISHTLAAQVENLTLSGKTDTRATGNTLDNTLNGNSGGNLIQGGAGNDILYGNAGKDTLDGGKGKDVMVGGAGADVFVFRKTSESTAVARDKISDFQARVDHLALRSIDANTRRSGDQDFLFDAAQTTFSGKAGELVFKRGILSGDVNGDEIADFSVALTDITKLGVGDMLL